MTIKRDNEEIQSTVKFNDSAKLGIAFATRLQVDNLEKLGLYKISKHEYGFSNRFRLELKWEKTRWLDMVNN